MQKIAYVGDALITCGGVITNFEHCRGLNKLGYDAFVVANGDNEELRRRYPDVNVYSFQMLNSMTDEDIIVANWWPQCEKLMKYKGRKIQFVQGNDLKAYVGTDWKEKCLKVRQDERWEIMAVSQYAGEWTGREFTIIPNGISDMFYEKLNLERDIDALIEGNDEPLKNIDYSINQAKQDGHKVIVWFGRQTRPVEGVTCINNPPYQEIPRLYQRAKHFYKHSLSEGFCLPLAEAIVSGCIIHAGDMGNTFTPEQDFRWETNIKKLSDYYARTNHS